MNEMHKKIIKALLDQHMESGRGDMVSTILGHDESDKADDKPENASEDPTEEVHGEPEELDAYGYPVEDETHDEDSEDCKCKDCKAKK